MTLRYQRSDTGSITQDSVDQLVPRRYQEEIFSRACKGNVIAALGTGSGKTFISLLLIKWIAAQQESSGKAIIFLVPKVALVHQQADYIAKFTSLRVIKLFGLIDLDPSDRKTWKRRFTEHDVLVMTAQIFFNIITHSLWSIDRVSLMIFDECHHARKNHPYNGILRERFQVAPSKRPKIFGMTASPIWDPRNAEQSLRVLEANMDSKVISVIDNVEELQEHSPKPVEIIKTYAPPPEDYPDYPLPWLHSYIKVFESSLRDLPDFHWQNIEGRYYVTWHNLGPYCASFFLFTELLHIARRSLQNSSTSTSSVHGYDFLPQPDYTQDINIINNILEDFEGFFPDITRKGFHLTIPLSWCTPKVKCLVDIIVSNQLETFRGIVFVEQRQNAACLATILPAIPELKGKVRCGHFVGQGVNNEGFTSSIGANKGDTLRDFRDGIINILVTTSVAEEGLDFPACDLVIRFDSLQHMVGYVQSRGRARNKASTFFIMVQENDYAQLARYHSLKETEPEVARIYHSQEFDMDVDESDDDELNLDDLLERERYVVPVTGAVLNYDNAIGLLNRLCALVPTDAFTPSKPVFSGDFEATLYLPGSLPLSTSDRVYTGPPKRSKKEAKRAVAFQAVRRLNELDVLDEYLLPLPPELGEGNTDLDRNILSYDGCTPEFLDVMVRNPWVLAQRLWIHDITENGNRIAGLVTGTRLVYDSMQCSIGCVEIQAGRPLQLDDRHEKIQRRDMAEFTKLGINYRLTGCPVPESPSLFLVPVTVDGRPDFSAIERLLESPQGYADWSLLENNRFDELLVIVSNYCGRIYRLRRVRCDLTPLSCPPPGSREYPHHSYKDYFMERWARKDRIPYVPSEGSMVELEFLPRVINGMYHLKPGSRVGEVTPSVHDGGLFPQGCCRWVYLSFDMYRLFGLLPAICHRITDTYRSVCLRSHLGLPAIERNLLIEALTLPSAQAGYNNQRLETLGDAVLQLCTTVHLYGRYPRRHEGQLTSLRQRIVSNRALLVCARRVALEEFLTNEIPSFGRWTYTFPEGEDDWAGLPARCVRRRIPRRSLQDCMEAILGASFLTGGIPFALSAGLALGLTLDWVDPHFSQRVTSVDSDPSRSPVSPYFQTLEDALGYKMRNNKLLLEAITHPSFSAESGGQSYQRLEFLGDAILSLAVMEYLYEQYPQASSYQLSMPRSKAVCAVALAWVAVKRLELHKLLLANNVDLNIAINHYVPVLVTASAEDIVERGWRYDPPKALSDIFESVIGAIFVDSGYNYDVTAAVIQLAMVDILEVLSPGVCRDPVSNLMEWTSGKGCRDVKIRAIEKAEGERIIKGMAVLIHDNILVGPIPARSHRISRFEVSSIALDNLKDGEGEALLKKLCNCKRTTKPTVTEDIIEEEEVEKMLLVN
ncbi:hypothetical protein AMATHDRAFT_73403 [Amanita thiersii Skay4041]|uniref:Dicer-like protein 1 n=1 Tax=Amanita thiersii Skay4041 TaxID=703135 RepID=A0A2A9NRI6_9AGAR|nr:hypothetical protein AMATHDRAFT_73403 [Amanita thiersii Skay4041]